MYWQGKSEKSLANDTLDALFQHVAYLTLHTGTVYLHFSWLSVHLTQLLAFLILTRFLFRLISSRPLYTTKIIFHAVPGDIRTKFNFIAARECKHFHWHCLFSSPTSVFLTLVEFAFNDKVPSVSATAAVVALLQKPLIYYEINCSDKMC